MDAESAVRELTRKGVMVTPEMLASIKRGERPDGARSGRKGLSVRIRKVRAMDRMSPEDFSAHYNARYSGLRSLLEAKVDAVSISNALQAQGEVSVIGMVRDTSSRGFVLEDATGEIEVVGKSEARQDDVVGATGPVREGRLMLSGLAWPDVPLTNEPASIEGLEVLLAGPGGGSPKPEGTGLAFLLGREGGSGDRVFSGLPNPCHAAVNKDGKELRMLMYQGPGVVEAADGRALLQRRHLSPPIREVSSREDPFLIDPVPGLLWLLPGDRHVERYKGVTIVISGESDVVKYDAGTGSVYFANGTPGGQPPGAAGGEGS